jgi:hypothetical protein
MRNLIFSILAAAFIFGSSSAASAQEWLKLAPEGANFEVMMPGTAKESVEEGTGAFGAYKVYLYMVPTADTIYLIGYSDYSDPAKMDIKAEINANRDNFMKSWKEGKILTEKDIKLGTNPGLEFTAQVDGGRIATSRIIMLGKRPYQLIAVTAAGADQSGVTKFLDSFKLTRK